MADPDRHADKIHIVNGISISLGNAEVNSRSVGEKLVTARRAFDQGIGSQVAGRHLNGQVAVLSQLLV
ncbi:MAG: hypothetical protein J2P32_07695 [Actinobacteria bacterium]|nr:hypothetical protein [Actinomycetota bacterium]